MRIKKTVKYIFYGLIAFFFLILISGVSITYFYKNELIDFFVNKANERLTVPVNVQKIDASFLKNFPEISIVLDSIKIKSPDQFEPDYLAVIREAQLTFNPLKVLQGKYEISNLILLDGTVNLEINENGDNNYQIVKRSDTTRREISTIIHLITDHIAINFSDKRTDKFVSFIAEDSKSKIRIENQLYYVNLEGGFLINKITVNELDYFANKSADIESSLVVDDGNKFVTIESSKIELEKGVFDVKGDVSYLDDTKVDLSVEGVNTNAQTLLSLLPEKYSDNLRGYRSRGEIYFNGTVKGEFTDLSYPNTILQFGAKEASFYHPDYKKSLQSIHLTGYFESGTRKDFSSARLQLKDMRLVLDDHPITGHLNITNFDYPYYDCAIKGTLDLNALIQSFPNTRIRNAFGRMDVDVRFAGRPGSKTSYKDFNADGEIMLDNVSFILKGEKLPFNQFDGSFIFKENDLAISDFSGKVGKSDFLLNGFFKNVAGLIDRNNKIIRIEADLSSQLLDFDELLMSNFASQDTTQTSGHQYSFNISPDIDLKFNCQVDHLNIKRFTGTDISGSLRVRDKIAYLNNVNVSTMGGKINLSGSVSNKVRNVVEIMCDANLKRVYIDSAFYVFKNFDQDWLVDKNLRGQINADVNTYILLDNHLKFYSDDFRADISASVINGELIDFEPMQKLSKFVEEESLAHLRFSEVQNDISIYNKTVYIPEMYVRSSVSTIKISGWHTFDQNIEYHLAVPLKNFLRLRKLREGDMQTNTDGSNLLLKIVGTTDDYEIKYDTKAVKEKISEDIKKEGQELKEIFKNKGKKEDQEPVKVEEEEYFDFDDQ